MVGGIGIILLSSFGITLLVGACIIIPQCIVTIGENEVGILFKKFNLNPLHPRLPDDQLIALKGEAGYQAKTLNFGRHFGYWSGMYTIRKEPVINVPQGEIALIVAKDGHQIQSGRMLGRSIPDCNKFQDAQRIS